MKMIFQSDNLVTKLNFNQLVKKQEIANQIQPKKMLFPFHTLLPYHIHPLLIQGTKHASKQQAYQIVDNSGELCLTMDVPGAKVADLTVSVDDKSIKVSIDRKVLKDKDEAQYNFLVDPKTTKLDSTTATLANGVLVVTSPKKPKEEPVTLTISNDTDDIAHATSALAADNMFSTTMDVPGIAKSDIQITVKENVVCVQGIRRISNSSNKNCHKKVRYSEVFQIDTDEVDIQHLKVFLVDGVLTIYGPKKTKPQPLSIPIQTRLASNTNDTSESTTAATSEDTKVEKVLVDVPGVKHTDISVKVLEGRLLSIEASRELPTARTYMKKLYLDQEVIDISRIEAFLENGQLVIALPQKINNTARKIEITVANEDEKSKETTNNDTLKENNSSIEQINMEIEHSGTHIKDNESSDTNVVKSDIVDESK